MEPHVARRTWSVLEPVHGQIYFAPEGRERYRAIGLDSRPLAYFGSRAAALGPVGPALVAATFYNFSARLVRHVVPEVWSRAEPAAILEARLATVDAALRRAFGPAVLAGPELAEVAALARRAAEFACGQPEGRPLFAAHAALAWPEEAHLVLWHGQTLLREFRGDGHIAALVGEGLSGLDALVTHGAAVPAWAPYLGVSRGWTDDEWQAAVSRLEEAGMLEHGPGPGLRFSTAGAEQRARIEVQTDRACLAPYAALGEDGCHRLRQLARPLSRAVVEAGLLPIDPAPYLGDEPPAD